MEGRSETGSSALSWNTFLSRTSVSSLSCAVFSAQLPGSTHRLDDVIRAIRALNLKRYDYEHFSDRELIGEGETYLVERCVTRDKDVLAVKHVKVSDESNSKLFQRRLKSVLLELKIMRHPPLKAHPNIASILGYGWNTKAGVIMPFVVVEHAAHGTFRQFVKQGQRLDYIETLLGDVASGLSALHTCRIVHGDVKLDNVIIFPSRDRPAKAIAKLTDFGHAIVLNDASQDEHKSELVYAGTSIYNAPEVENQANCPISRDYLIRCDVWAFGLLIWEACIMGEDYLAYVERTSTSESPESNSTTEKPQRLDHEFFLTLAKRSVPGPRLGAPFFLRIAIHKCLSTDPIRRVPDITSLPLYTKWNTSQAASLQAKLALHIEAPSPTYEHFTGDEPLHCASYHVFIFRVDNGRDIPWTHQQQILESLLQVVEDSSIKDVTSIIWQVALCYHVGFGTPRDPTKADEFARIAKMKGHAVATEFAHLLALDDPEIVDQEEEYAAQVARLLRSEPDICVGVPQIVRASRRGDKVVAERLLDQGAFMGSSTVDGCSLLHWLFTFRDQEDVNGIISKLREMNNNNLTATVNMPFTLPIAVHSQWPLQLLGTPLAVAISVNSLTTVKALHKLGADFFSPVYHGTQFGPEDLHLNWSAFHVAAKYHCADILRYLLENSDGSSHRTLTSMGCALSFSTSLERRAMHGSERARCLAETVRLIHNIEPLQSMAPNGMTALMQAIDFQDFDVVMALLEVHPELAVTAFAAPHNSHIFTFPIHFAIQIGSKREESDTAKISKLIFSYATKAEEFSSPPQDHNGRTPLHLAATGESRHLAEWVLGMDLHQLHTQDSLGRTPLHYCTSSAVCAFLIEQGAQVNQVDKAGMTPLHLLCLSGMLDPIPALLKAKSDLGLNMNDYGTPLHCAVISGSVDTVRLLIEANSSLDAIDTMGNTPAHVAVQLDRWQILCLLCQHGANTMLQNNHLREPWHIAQDKMPSISDKTLQLLRPSHQPPVYQQMAGSPIANVPASLHQNQQKMRQPEDAEPDFMWLTGKAWSYDSIQAPAPDTESSFADEAEAIVDARYDELYGKAMHLIANTTINIRTTLPWQSRPTTGRLIGCLVTMSVALIDKHVWHADFAPLIMEAVSRTTHRLSLEIIRWNAQDEDRKNAYTAPGSLKASIDHESNDAQLPNAERRYSAILHVLISHISSLIHDSKHSIILPGRRDVDIKLMMLSQVREVNDTTRTGDQGLGEVSAAVEHTIVSLFGEMDDFFNDNSEAEQRYTQWAGRKPRRPAAAKIADRILPSDFEKEQEWRRNYKGPPAPVDQVKSNHRSRVSLVSSLSGSRWALSRRQERQQEEEEDLFYDSEPVPLYHNNR
ncbi:hypothetical protein LLEC1_03548 [Akanthomyces lecanii]|uniref:Protein kinase domain-containing protein n=1 Tax=Cordyceps confragosa TaxID=2714763 RepID=A0A179I5D0_CORDF|nr:hypothetical protein LLEC1_03548 [Akanthomyces lecanii]